MRDERERESRGVSKGGAVRRGAREFLPMLT